MGTGTNGKRETRLVASSYYEISIPFSFNRALIRKESGDERENYTTFTCYELLGVKYYIMLKKRSSSSPII
jgi:hypothetical protein